jgi:hypothetical protein
MRAIYRNRQCIKEETLVAIANPSDSSLCIRRCRHSRSWSSRAPLEVAAPNAADACAQIHRCRSSLRRNPPLPPLPAPLPAPRSRGHCSLRPNLARAPPVPTPDHGLRPGRAPFLWTSQLGPRVSAGCGSGPRGCRGWDTSGHCCCRDSAVAGVGHPMGTRYPHGGGCGVI